MMRSLAKGRGIRCRQCRGQAMTETVIVAAFVLIPVFFLLPMIGKFIDVRHSAIQAARYEAWEYTVYYATSSDKPDGLGESVPVKSIDAVRNEARRRFLSRTDVPIQASDANTGWVATDARPLWTTFDGQRMYDGTSTQNQPNVQTQLTTPPDDGTVSEIIRGVVDMLDVVFSTLGDVMDFLGADASFDAIDTDGYIKADMSAAVETTEIPFGFPGSANFPEQSLAFSGAASVLSNGWGSGSTDYTRRQVRGMVPTSLLDSPVFNVVQDIASVLFISPEISSSSLRFGYVPDDVVHPDRLSESPWQGHNCTGGVNACDFNPK